MTKAKDLKSGKELTLRERVNSNVLSEFNTGLVKFVYEVTDEAEELSANVTADNAPNAAEVVARLRAAEKELKAVAADAMKEERAKIKKVDGGRLDLEKRIKALTTAIEAKFIPLFKAGEISKITEGPLGSTITVVEKDAAKILDADKIPDDFLLPLPTRAERVNTAAVLAILKAGGTVEGAELTKSYSLLSKAREGVS